MRVGGGRASVNADGSHAGARTAEKVENYSIPRHSCDMDMRKQNRVTEPVPFLGGLVEGRPGNGEGVCFPVGPVPCG